jgi:hypothetical protein
MYWYLYCLMSNIKKNWKSAFRITLCIMKKQDTSTTELNSSKMKELTCDVCDKISSSIYTFHKHMNTHTRLRTFTCNICCANFFEKNVLKKHQKIHSGDRPFKCSICEKVLFKKSIFRTIYWSILNWNHINVIYVPSLSEEYIICKDMLEFILGNGHMNAVSAKRRFQRKKH